MNFLSELPQTKTIALRPEVPYRLTIEQFHALPVVTEVLTARQMIYALEAYMLDLGDQGVDIIRPDTLTPVHRFTKGIYARELTMPAGVVIVGKRHAQEHLVMMTEGKCTVFTERGQEDLVAPCTFISPAGEKRVLFINEQTTWTCIHRTDATDLDSVEADLILAEDARDVVNKLTMREE
jgi:quercetin dioxygenase-like cupin family protein